MDSDARSVTASARNAGIDFVRGLSIVMVMFNHIAIRIPLLKSNLAAFLPRILLHQLSYFGYESVFVFFVVSGFLITRNTIHRWGHIARVEPRAFYIRRAARILPCLVVLVAVLSALDLAKVPYYTIMRPGQSLWRAIVAVFGLHLNWYEGHTGYLPAGWDVLWSLAIEEVFYLGFPLLCLTVGRYRRFSIILFALAAFALPFALNQVENAPEVWREKAYFPGMSAIAMGVLAALLAAAIPKPSAKLTALIGWAASAILVALFWGEWLSFELIGNVTMLILTVSVALLLLSFHFGWGQWLASWPTAWLRSFGRRSYEIYLTHVFVIFPLVALSRYNGGDLHYGWVWFFPVLALAWVLGFLVARYVSAPADRWLCARAGLKASNL